MARRLVVSAKVRRVSAINPNTLPYAKTATVKAARKRTETEINLADVNALAYCNELRRALRVARYAHKSAAERKAYIKSIGRKAYDKQVAEALAKYKAAMKSYDLTDATARAYGRGTGSFSKQHE